MQGEDDTRGLAKIMGFMRAVSIIVVLMHFYWFCYRFFKNKDWTLSLLNRILANFQETAGLFSEVIYTKLFALLLLALSCLGTKGVKNEGITWKKINLMLCVGTALFFLNTWLLYGLAETGEIMYMVSAGTGYITLMVAGLWMSRLLQSNLMQDVFNQENESFMQETRLMENEYSVNLNH